jgi:hypothetical protein
MKNSLFLLLLYASSVHAASEKQQNSLNFLQTIRRGYLTAFKNNNEPIPLLAGFPNPIHESGLATHDQLDIEKYALKLCMDNYAQMQEKNAKKFKAFSLFR